MKKYVVYTIVAAMILSLVSCGESGSRTAAAPKDAAAKDAAATGSSALAASLAATELAASPNGDYSTMGTLAEESPVIDGIYTAPVEYKADEGKYYLTDLKRRFRVGNFNGKTSKDENFKPVYSAGNSIFGDTEEEADQELYKGFYLTTEIGKIRDYFLKSFGVDTQGHTLFIGYNDGKEDGKNAYGGVGEDKTYSTIYVGKNVSFPCRDILAHEYTHTIQYMHHFVQDVNEKGSEVKIDEETVTISEGLADVFACFYTGKWDLDFTPLGNGVAHRNAANPSGNHKANIHDEVKSSEKEYGYNYATCISRAAYLMSESKAFTKEALQSLWFDAMVSLTAHCKYTDLREAMEKAAIRAKMTGKQKLALANAFDAVGISHFDTAAKYNGDIEVAIYDHENNFYDDYKVEIYRLIKDSRDNGATWNYTTTFAESHDRNKPEPLQLHLDEGTYRILISDNSPGQKIVDYTIAVDPASGKRLIEERNFDVPDSEDAGPGDSDGEAEPEDSGDSDGEAEPEDSGDSDDAAEPEDSGDEAAGPGDSQGESGEDGGDGESSDGFQGLWITFSSMGTLYYFDSGKVTCYGKTDYSAPVSDRHYTKKWTRNYIVEDLSGADGPGRAAVLESGIEYRLIDGSPDVLDCYFLDENNRYQLSGSGSLMRVTDYTIDDLILQ